MPLVQVTLGVSTSALGILYVVDIGRSGIDSAAELPKTAQIDGGRVILDIDIDTGIVLTQDFCVVAQRVWIALPTDT